MKCRNGKLNPIGNSTGQERASSNKKEPKIARREIQSDTEIIKRRDQMGRIRVSVVQSRYGEIRVENLVQKSRVGEKRWVRDRK